MDVKEESETQTSSSRIWTRLDKSTHFDDNRYTTNVFIYEFMY